MGLFHCLCNTKLLKRGVVPAHGMAVAAHATSAGWGITVPGAAACPAALASCSVMKATRFLSLIAALIEFLMLE